MKSAHARPIGFFALSARYWARIGAVLFALAAAGAASAESYWRWVDANGVVNYTQQKPYGVEATRVNTLPGRQRRADAPVAPPSPAAPSTGSPSEDQQRILDELRSAEDARQQEVARIEQENCDRSRGLLDQLSVRSRIRVRNADGTARTMDEEERQRRISEAQEGIAEYCRS